MIEIHPAHPEVLALLRPEIITEIEQRGFDDLYPPQWEGIIAGLKGNNLVISIPTASGKTLIAEVLAIQRLLNLPKLERKHQKILYLAPLKALSNEKYKEFVKAWKDKGIFIGISISDLDQHDFKVFSNDLIISTNEKATSLLQQNPSLFSNIGMVICDEIHLMNDETRGVTLEFLLTRIRTLSPRTQILGLSATIKNAEQLATWLNAQLITSDWRPVDLKEGYFSQDRIIYGDGTERRVYIGDGTDPFIALTIDMLKEGGQVLIFANSRKNAMSMAEKLHTPVRLQMKPEDQQRIKGIGDEFRKITDIEIEANRNLLKFIQSGVAFHHAGLANAELDFIVEQFNKKRIKVICATPTLAAGVNTPARRVIIQSLYRYSGEKGNQLIPILEYKQMAGRAGRPGFDPYGEVVILGSNLDRLESVAEQFIHGEPEQIRSKLAEENQLSFHVLGLISGKYAHTQEELLGFLKNTFYYYQMRSGTFTQIDEERKPNHQQIYRRTEPYTTPKLLKKTETGRGRDPLHIQGRSDDFITAATLIEPKEIIETNSKSNEGINDQIDPRHERLADKDLRTHLGEIITYLHHHEFISQLIDRKTEYYKDTPFGHTTVQMYLTPADALILKEAMQYAQALLLNKEITLTPISWLHTLTKISECPTFYLRKNDQHMLVDYIDNHAENFIEEVVPDPADMDYPSFAVHVKSTVILEKWIQEMPEKEMVDAFEIGPGDIHRLTDIAKWLMRAFVQFAKALKFDLFQHDLEELSDRVTYGIREELIPLISLRGIGRVRARKLFHEGLKTLEDLKNATEEQLAAVPLIGKELARKIKEQLADLGEGEIPKKNRVKKTTKKVLMSRIDESTLDSPQNSEIDNKIPLIPSNQSDHAISQEKKMLDQYIKKTTSRKSSPP